MNLKVEREHIKELIEEYGSEKAREEYLDYVNQRLDRISDKIDWSCAANEYVDEDRTLLEALEKIEIDDSIEKKFRVGLTSKEMLDCIKDNLKDDETAKELFLRLFEEEEFKRFENRVL